MATKEVAFLCHEPVTPLLLSVPFLHEIAFPCTALRSSSQMPQFSLTCGNFKLRLLDFF